MKIRKVVIVILSAAMVFALCALIAACAPSKKITREELIEKTKYGVVEIAADEDRGSGVIVSAGNKTVIITSYHVVENAVRHNEDPNVKFFGSDDYHIAEIVGYFQEYDIAVLEVNYKYNDAYVFKFASAKIGADVFALAYNEGALAAYDGIISMEEKVIKPYNEDMFVIQSTTSFAPGSSGGALMNYDGELIGITAFGHSYNGEYIYSGVGYSVPAEIAAAVWQRVEEGNKLGGYIPYKPAAGFDISSNGKMFVSLSAALTFELERKADGIYVSYADPDTGCPFGKGDKIATVNGVKAQTMTLIIAEIIKTYKETAFVK